MLGVSPRTIRNYITANLLPFRKIGRRTVILVHALEAFLRTDHASPVSSRAAAAAEPESLAKRAATVRSPRRTQKGMNSDAETCARR
jgi:hypothetical protein